MGHQFKFISFVFLILALFQGGCGTTNPRPIPRETRAHQRDLNTENAGWVPDGTAVYPKHDALPPGLVDRGKNDLVPGADNDALSNAIAKVYFDYDKSGVSADQRSKLKEVAAYMNEDTSSRVLIQGHCDWRGTVEYNLALGERRAKSVAKYLTDLGIAKNRIDTLSKGHLEAIANSNKQEMAQDRRADVIPVN